MCFQIQSKTPFIPLLFKISKLANYLILHGFRYSILPLIVIPPSQSEHTSFQASQRLRFREHHHSITLKATEQVNHTKPPWNSRTNRSKPMSRSLPARNAYIVGSRYMSAAIFPLEVVL